MVEWNFAGGVASILWAGSTAVIKNNGASLSG